MNPGRLPGTEIDVLSPVQSGEIKHAIFDFDGTISLLREGWEAIMEPFMVNTITGGHWASPAIKKSVTDFIDESTGIQTILQMAELVEMVRGGGFVAEEDVLSPQEYKAQYNEALMVGVRERILELGFGDRTMEDVTLRGAREMVAGLRDRGVVLYLASGTDQDDVRREAEILGVASFFEGGMWGALKTFEEYSKDKVIKRIIAEHNLSGSEVMVCGDGPVEIRNAKANGCIAVGVASDEVAGHGWNERKRVRLTKAGADIMVPDFSEYEQLLELLFNG